MAGDNFGSVVPISNDTGDVQVPAGCEPASHIFTACMAPWYAIEDDLP